MLQRILVGLDGSPLAESILAYVGALAKGLDAEVTLLHVVPLSPSLQKGEFYRFLGPLIQQEEIHAYEYLRRVTQQLVDAGIKVQSRVTRGEVAAEILRTAQQDGMELIALATHGRSGLQRWFYGSVAEKVLHTTQTPLLLIRPGEEEATLPQGLSQIVVPLDGSPLAEIALPVAKTLAARLKVPLVLVRVVEIVSLSFIDPAGTAGVNYQAILDSLQAASDTYLNQLAATVHSKEVNVQTATPMGLPADKIVGYAHDHPGSLVVMATHGRTGFTNLALGSVARRVVQHGNTPTLIVRASTPPAAAGASSDN